MIASTPRRSSERHRCAAHHAEASSTHRFKQPDGRRYPESRPDGLLSQVQLTKALGVGKSTVHKWQGAGLIAPVCKEGHCQLYKMPTPEELETIRSSRREAWLQGAARGGYEASDRNISQVNIGLAQAKLAANRGAAQPEGTLTFALAAEVLAVRAETVASWVRKGRLVCVGSGKFGRFLPIAVVEAFAKTRAEYVPVAAQVRGAGVESAALSAAPCRVVKPVPSRPELAGLFSIEELADQAGVALGTLRAWLKDGLIPAPAAVGRNNRQYFQPLAPDRVAQIREVRRVNSIRGSGKGGQTRKESGALAAQLRAAKTAALEAHQATRPEGALSYKEAAAEIGVAVDTLRGRIRHGYVAVLPGCWIAKGELVRHQADWATRKAAPKATQSTGRSVYTTVPTKVLAPLRKAPLVVEVPPTREVSTQPDNYDDAVKAGRLDPALSGVLGFNLLMGPGRVFRAALVGTTPPVGWHYHEKHHKDGFGRWQSRALAAKTGRLL
ncbi:MerR family transcriptional regulator [Armatimonas sp.]|uniref:MerR family transcriptional regulator n=1 Tax=Armatimonas sp. TaxID=1872638 RepID=UPI00375100A2